MLLKPMLPSRNLPRDLQPGDAARVRDGRGKPTAHEAQRSVRGLVPNSPTPLFRGHALKESKVLSLESLAGDLSTV